MNTFKSSLLLSATQGAPLDATSVLFIAFFIIAIGLVSVFLPRVFWHLRIGRKIPGVPPSTLYLMVLRFGGLLTLALGVYLIRYAYLIP